ncbi:MAG: acylphosphatase [Phyllobacterium sp.]|uniref:acylphosphatase n=1 Tax=Phyllobacterium sp. TaxID=1871046 RepID=UPI0030F02731
MQDKHRAKRVRISGRVQGVSFRVWTRMEARRLGLGGWVRNEPDGTVTALIEGPDAAVSAMLDLFWQGPPGASVADVKTEDAGMADMAGDFRITS